MAAHVLRLVALAAALLAALPALAEPEPSVCHGTTSKGSLENGWRLPRSGPNFSAYSSLAITLGRTYVHSTVHAIVVDAYAALEASAPGTVFVYGETGFAEGGQFKPHKTHRNGLSVDFMVPVRNRDGESVPLPTHAFNRWGYDLDFDANGVRDDLTIDWEAISEHVHQLDVAARRHGVEIWRVIFAPDLQPFLHETRRWPALRKNVRFSEKQSWVRHDDHYHVDFRVPCR